MSKRPEAAALDGASFTVFDITRSTHLVSASYAVAERPYGEFIAVLVDRASLAVFDILALLPPDFRPLGRGHTAPPLSQARAEDFLGLANEARWPLLGLVRLVRCLSGSGSQGKGATKAMRSIPKACPYRPTAPGEERVGLPANGLIRLTTRTEAFARLEYYCLSARWL